MLADVNSVLQSVSGLAMDKFVPGVLALDPFYLAVTLALLGVMLVFFLALLKVRAWVIALVKKLILLGIILASSYLFITSFYDKLSVEALKIAPLQTIVLGVAGGIVLLLSLFIAVFSLGSHARKRKKPEQGKPSTPSIEPTTLQQPKMLTTQALKNQVSSDRSLMAVISYVIIAEFGIFSSPTLPAPSVSAGMIFFGVFFLGAFIFIRTSYRNYVKGVAHLLVATAFAVALSVFLGYFWGRIALSTLLSLDYFGTTALVAVVTGIAVSLLMGSRG